MTREAILKELVNNLALAKKATAADLRRRHVVLTRESMTESRSEEDADAEIVAEQAGPVR